VILNEIFPQNVIEFCGLLSLLLAVIFTFWSMHSGSRAQATKLLAVCFIAGFSLCSNHPTTYFAAIFIIATAVTELEFLQNLAAIIRGNSDYFDYKKEALSKEEKESKETLENKKLGLTIKTFPAKIEVAPKATPNFLEVEDAAMESLAKQYNYDIERNVRLKNSRGQAVEFDGLVTGDESVDTIIEVKYIKDLGRVKDVWRFTEIYEDRAKMYKQITGRAVKIHPVFVVNEKSAEFQEFFNKLTDKVDHSLWLGGCSLLTFSDIGINA
jgi:hypothetical protein